jgi:hypothetical protein
MPSYHPMPDENIGQVRQGRFYSGHSPRDTNTHTPNRTNSYIAFVHGRGVQSLKHHSLSAPASRWHYTDACRYITFLRPRRRH